MPESARVLRAWPPPAASCPRRTRGMRRRRWRCRRCRPRRRTSRWPRACRRRRRARTPCCGRWHRRWRGCLRRTGRTRIRRPARSRRWCRPSRGWLPRRSAVSGPMSRIISSPCTSPTGRTSACAVAANSLATTTSVGSGISAPRARRLVQQLAGDVQHFRLVQRLADVHAGGREEGVGDAAADDQLVHLREQRFEHGELGGDLRARDDGHQRPRGLLEARAPAHRARPRAAGRRRRPWRSLPTPCVLASARCAVPKASITNTSHSAAILRESSGSSFFSPLLKRTFSQSTACPGWQSTPSSQSLRSGTGCPSSSERRAATGASDSDSS